MLKSPSGRHHCPKQNINFRQSVDEGSEFACDISEKTDAPALQSWSLPPICMQRDDVYMHVRMYVCERCSTHVGMHTRMCVSESQRIRVSYRKWREAKEGQKYKNKEKKRNRLTQRNTAYTQKENINANNNTYYDILQDRDRARCIIRWTKDKIAWTRLTGKQRRRQRGRGRRRKRSRRRK